MGDSKPIIMVFKYLFLLLALVTTSVAQQQIPFTIQSVVGVVTTLPVTCTTNDIYVLNPVTPGLYACVSTNQFKFIPTVQVGSSFPTTCETGSAFIRVDQTAPNFYVCNANQYSPPGNGVTYNVSTAGGYPLPVAPSGTLSSLIISDIGNGMNALSGNK
jgi:hypothetical protein